MATERPTEHPRTIREAERIATLDREGDLMGAMTLLQRYDCDVQIYGKGGLIRVSRGNEIALLATFNPMQKLLADIARVIGAPVPQHAGPCNCPDREVFNA
jgi:hypothetical protein